MGRDISSETFSREQRRKYRLKLSENLETFARYLQKADFVDEATIGLEMEINLITPTGEPTLTSMPVLQEIDSEEFTTEIGAHNIELNFPVLQPGGRGLADLEAGLVERLATAGEAAKAVDTQLVTVGMLPSLTEDVLRAETWMNPERRYAALNSSVVDSRGEDIRMHFTGDEEVDFYIPTIAPEAACTSVQLHLQVHPSEFAPSWNAAQAIGGPQVALAANSPFFVGRKGWHESRIVVFQQAIDTRPPELAAQGVRPRVWFGDRWINSVFDLWEENVRWFPALIPESREAAGEPLLTEAAAPRLHELVLHNGTIWRWNRPVYDPGTDRPHLRLENRILPAGPTVKDTVANAAFFYGAVEALKNDPRPLWSRMEFDQAWENFYDCAEYGLDARVVWPGIGKIGVDDLLAEELIPLAARGMASLGVDEDLISEYTSILQGRVETGRNGARWQLDTVDELEEMGLSRADALIEMTLRYRRHQLTNEPVHTWPGVS
jgi:gamma-glutamyl:cysteine ligase YbdK (ATP-grasp superfamily)